MAHVQHQQHAQALAATGSSVIKLQPPPAKRLVRHGSLQPQNNDEDNNETTTSSSDDEAPTTKDEPPRCLSDRGLVARGAAARPTRECGEDNTPLEDSPSTLLPELQLICSLTRRITNALTATSTQQDGDRDDEPIISPASLAALYCTRASALLEYAKFDASERIPLALLESLDTALAGRDGALITGGELCVVQQAREDALAAIALAPALSEAYFVAAQCSRSLGESANALELATRALRLTPQSRRLHRLLRELSVDVDTTRHAFAPPLLCRSTAESDEPDEQQQQQPLADVDDPEDDDVSLDLRHRFRAVEALAASPLLLSLEQMMHEALHHQCASRDEAAALSIAWSRTVDLLRVLLTDAATTSRAILMEATVLRDVAQQLRDPRRLVDSIVLRKWIVRTLAPAVVQSIPDDFGGMFANERVVNSGLACRAALLRDVLLVLARLLLAEGSLWRCTNGPRALAATKMAYELTKQLASDAEPNASSAVFARMETVCADAYAVALLDLAGESGEALLLHQESLETAARRQDRGRELRSRHALGRALFHIREYEAARGAFAQLLQQSQAIGDSALECLALYHLGEYHVAVGDLDEAARLLERALRVCNQTANGRGTWRPRSIERAIAFYACMRPARRRPAIAPSRPRKATLVVTPRVDGERGWEWPEEKEKDEEKEEEEEEGEEEEEEKPKQRRAAVWMAPETGRSLAETVIGGYVREQETAKPKSKRDARWRDSVVTVVRQQETAEVTEEEGEEKEEEVVEEEERTSVMETLFGRASSSSGGIHSPTRPACWKPVD